MKLSKHVEDYIKFKNLRTQMAECKTPELKTLGDFDGDKFRFSKKLEEYVQYSNLKLQMDQLMTNFNSAVHGNEGIEGITDMEDIEIII